MTQLRRFAFAVLAAPITLALAACGSDDAATGGLSGDPIAAIPAPEGQSWTQTAVVTELGGIQVGNPDAPLKLVEYASHTCPACANFSAEAHTAIDEYVATGVVSFELRNQVHDPLDLTFAMLVRCGDPTTAVPLATQGWANLNEIVGNAQANGEALSQAMAVQDETRFQQIAEISGLLDFFAARGVSRDQAMQCLADPDLATQIVERSQTQSEELDVTGTPTFFLNGTKLNGSGWAVIEPVLQQAGAR